MRPRPLAPALALALAALGLAGCRVAEAHVYNLREVRDPDGSARRIGAPMRPSEYLIRNSLVSQLAADELGVAEKADDAIEDPDALALENLIELMRCDADDPWVLGLQVEMTTWLAVDDAYRLARERAAIALGELGARLGVEQPHEPVAAADAARPDDLVGPLADLVGHVRGLLRGGFAPGEALEETCAELRAATLDREGARRVVAATNALLRTAGRGRPELAPLEALFRDTCRRAVALALGEAMVDPDPWVRAAAIDAALVATDDRLVGLRLQAIEDGAEEVMVRTLRGIAERGLWIDPALPPDEIAATRHAFLGRMVALTRDLRGRVSAAACAALIRTSESGLATLRWEAWARWWEGEVAARNAATEVDRADP